MRSLSNFTNGVMVLSDSFATTIFKEAFFRLFDKDEQGHLTMGFNATFDVQVRKLDSLWIYPIDEICRQQKS